VTIVPIQLPQGSSVLVAGAGGGWDVLCGLPIALELEEAGHPAHFASYSFTDLAAVEGGTWHGPGLALEIDADCSLREGDYFPELSLARWLRESGSGRRVFCLPRAGALPTREAYDLLARELAVDCVFCVDGGVDGIFRGDEHDLGTPSMDSISVIAAAECQVARRIYATTAFGVEGAEGQVCHAQALARMADLIRGDAMLGVGVVLARTTAGRRFVEAAEWIFARLPPLRRGIIVSSMLAAVRGEFGRQVVHEKARERPPWISPLTALVFYFDARGVAELKLFYDAARTSRTVEDVAAAIERVRVLHGVLPPERIPI
jgi:hypothetical protein